MKFYFSGIASKKELAMLQVADIKRVMVDVFQADNISDWSGSRILDSGAYAMSKGRQVSVGIGLWQIGVEDLATVRPGWDLVFALDKIGDPDTTLYNWRFLQQQNSWLTFTPVYQWGAPLDHLHEYLSASNIVGIGGLVQMMREKNQPMLDSLATLCQQYPKRFHIFGINWPKAITLLRDSIYSADSSKWLDGARYRRAIFEHSTYGYLATAPARFVTRNYPELEGISREDLCSWNACNIAAFCED